MWAPRLYRPSVYGGRPWEIVAYLQSDGFGLLPMRLLKSVTLRNNNKVLVLCQALLRTIEATASWAWRNP